MERLSLSPTTCASSGLVLEGDAITSKPHLRSSPTSTRPARRLHRQGPTTRHRGQRRGGRSSKVPTWGSAAPWSPGTSRSSGGLRPNAGRSSVSPTGRADRRCRRPRLSRRRCRNLKPSDSDARHVVAEPAEMTVIVEFQLALPGHVLNMDQHLEAAIWEDLDLDMILAPRPVDENISGGSRRERCWKTFGTRNLRHKADGVGCGCWADGEAVQAIPVGRQGAQFRGTIPRRPYERGTIGQLDLAHAAFSHRAPGYPWSSAQWWPD